MKSIDYLRCLSDGYKHYGGHAKLSLENNTHNKEPLLIDIKLNNGTPWQSELLHVNTFTNHEHIIFRNIYFVGIKLITCPNTD